MYRISMKVLFTIILFILGLSGLTIYELINLNMIQIDFVPMDAKYLNGINEESMIYVLKSVGFFSLILSFSLIIIPVFIWKKDDESITKILVFLLLITY